MSGLRLNGPIAAIDPRFNGLSDDVSEISSDLAGLSGSVSEISADLSEVTGDVVNITSLVDVVSGDVSGLTDGLAALSGTVTGISDGLGEVTSDVGTLNGQVSALSTSVTDVSNDLTALTTDVGNKASMQDVAGDLVALTQQGEERIVPTTAALASTDPSNPGTASIGTTKGIDLEYLLSLIDGNVFYPELFGMIADGGDVSAAANFAALNALRIAAETYGNGCQVKFSPGVYTLPEGARLDADNTEWIFAPGAILKLYSTQVINQDFLVFDRPVRQIVRNLQFDANRAAQDPALFGPDRCGTLVVSPTGCLFDGVEVISSPGKGFGVASAAGETSSGTDVRNVRGGNCATQAVIFDANNSTGFFSNCTLDGVRIGVTSHAGVAINDGVADCTISNIYCNVGPDSVWDAVAFRDVSHLKISHVKGIGGRNGVAFQKLNTECADLDLLDIHGEGAAQNGVQFLAVKRVRGSLVTGRNSAATGVNLARINSGDQRCEDIHLTGVTGIDTRSTPAQQYGILLSGTRRCSIKDWTATGNTVENAWLVASVNEKSFIEWEQEFSAAIPSQAANALFDFSIPLTGVPFLAEYIAIRVPPILNCGTSQLALAAAGQEVAFDRSIYTAKGRNQSGTTAWEGVSRVVIGSKR